jgi:hypothetical protein
MDLQPVLTNCVSGSWVPIAPRQLPAAPPCSGRCVAPVAGNQNRTDSTSAHHHAPRLRTRVSAPGWPSRFPSTPRRVSRAHRASEGVLDQMGSSRKTFRSRAVRARYMSKHPYFDVAPAQGDELAAAQAGEGGDEVDGGVLVGRTRVMTSSGEKTRCRRCGPGLGVWLGREAATPTSARPSVTPSARWRRRPVARAPARPRPAGRPPAGPQLSHPAAERWWLLGPARSGAHRRPVRPRSRMITEEEPTRI